jgi:hypothetical protein
MVRPTKQWFAPILTQPAATTAAEQILIARPGNVPLDGVPIDP